MSIPQAPANTGSGWKLHNAKRLIVQPAGPTFYEIYSPTTEPDGNALYPRADNVENLPDMVRRQSHQQRLV